MDYLTKRPMQHLTKHSSCRRRSKNHSDPYLELFFTAWDKVKGEEKLASPDIFLTRSLDGSVSLGMSDSQVKDVLREKVEESVQSSISVLDQRINNLGVAQASFNREGNTSRIMIELPGAKDVSSVSQILTSTAQLEFWETAKLDATAYQFYLAADQKLAEILYQKKKRKLLKLHRIAQRRQKGMTWKIY